MTWLEAHLMKFASLALPAALLIICSPIACMTISAQQSTPSTLLYADFTGSMLPEGWFLQGSAKFIGGLNASSGVGGIQLVNSDSEEGAAIYANPVTAQNMIIEFSGMYENVSETSIYGRFSPPEADNIGVGFYSGGPSVSVGPDNPASPNGYYAAYEFYKSYVPSLMYNGRALSSGGNLPSTGQNYIFARTIVSSTSISLNALTRTSSVWVQEPLISLQTLVMYNNATGIDSSHSTLYVGGATMTGFYTNPWSEIYVYWLRALTYPSSISSVSSSVTLMTVSQTPSVTQSVTMTATSFSTMVVTSGFLTVASTTSYLAAQPVATAPTYWMDNPWLVAIVGGLIVAGIVSLWARGTKKIDKKLRKDRGQQEVERYCPKCGILLFAGEKFCRGCGTEI